MTTKIEGPITSIGTMAGTIMISPQGSLPVTVKVSENQRTKMLPRLVIGDVIAVNVRLCPMLPKVKPFIYQKIRHWQELRI